MIVTRIGFSASSWIWLVFRSLLTVYQFPSAAQCSLGVDVVKPEGFYMGIAADPLKLAISAAV
jgi:hypothetical protein